MEKYDGSSDHVDHLRAVNDWMMLQAIHGVIMYRAFLPTLKQRFICTFEARDWVATLLLKFICTFDDFSKQFATYLASSKRAKKKAIELMQLTQDKDELLNDFITRFNRATLEINDLQMSNVFTAMIVELAVTFSRCHPPKICRIRCMSY
ncbi:Retrotransposon gag protein [Abeliophyllum distichum]|uniref:Retrotransposon gag protein n=1 Tax=Abeliophyllum distichum TaxID=126358 RepID=A0ABD1TZ09_9LAMI